MTRIARNEWLAVALFGAVLGVTCLFNPPRNVMAQAVLASPKINGGVYTGSTGTGFSVDQNLKSAATHQRLMGWSVSESAGSAGVASGNFRATPGGAGACTGTVLGTFSLAASTGQTVFLPQGVDAATGVCIDVLEGTVEVVAYTYIQP